MELAALQLLSKSKAGQRAAYPRVISSSLLLEAGGVSPAIFESGQPHDSSDSALDSIEQLEWIVMTACHGTPLVKMADIPMTVASAVGQVVSHVHSISAEDVPGLLSEFNIYPFVLQGLQFRGESMPRVASRFTSSYMSDRFRSNISELAIRSYR